MLDFGFSEILLTSAIALVVLGPERLPKVARQVGNWVGRARVMARQLTEQLEREVNAEELLKEQNKVSQSVPVNRIAPPDGSPAAGSADAPPAAESAGAVTALRSEASSHTTEPAQVPATSQPMAPPAAPFATDHHATAVPPANE